MSEAQTVQLSYDDGARAVELAREAVESFVRHGQREQPGSMREAFYARTGAFVRLESTRGRGRLRGCAGAWETSDQLGHAIVEAAIKAASGDSCGSEVEPKELDNITVSVFIVSNTVLTNDPLADLESRHPRRRRRRRQLPRLALSDGPRRERLVRRRVPLPRLPEGQNRPERVGRRRDDGDAHRGTGVPRARRRRRGRRAITAESDAYFSE